jgi:flagellin-like protein
MIPSSAIPSDRSNRAVSPVIGVILMVAITVILAAVIGAFVLEIGDQQETAPSTSFDSEQRVQYMDDSGNHKLNTTEVSISHAGGEVIDITQVAVKVEGNSSVWGLEELDNGGGFTHVTPVPDVRQTQGTNQVVEFTSGETWSIIAYGGSSSPNPVFAHEYVEDTRYRIDIDATGADEDKTPIRIRDSDSGPDTNRGRPFVLDPDEQVNVVWSASSGGKTQTLFKYTVQ